MRAARAGAVARRCAVVVSIAAGVALAACTSPSEPIAPVLPSLTSFTLEAARNPALAADVAATITGDTILLEIPDLVAVDSLVPSWATAEAATLVTIDGQFPASGTLALDLTADLPLTLTSSTGHARSYVVRTVVFTGLPAIRITTDGGAPIDSRDTYVGASIEVFGGKEHPEWSFTARTQIRGRGNSTWDAPKKPYRLRLASSASMFGFPADRDWALLANYWDGALVRNAVAFEVSRRLGMAFTPRCAPFEMFVNGAHQGSYQLCDHVEVAANRVPAGSDGWFLELDERRRVEAGDEWFETPRIREYTTVGHGDTMPSVWVFKQPDPPTAGQRAAISGELLALEDVLYSPYFTSPDSGYATRLDPRALADWYVVNELTKNNDAAFSFGLLVHKPAGGRIAFGPVWDFDLALGNYPWDFGPEGWKIRPSGWMPRFFEDAAFVALVKERWAVLRADRTALDAFIVDYCARLRHSQARSHALWNPYQPRPSYVVDFDAEVAYVRGWLAARIDWLDARIPAL